MACGCTHVLVFPYPAQGHMLPLLDLALELSLRGLSVTVLVTPANLPSLSPLLARAPSAAALVLPFPSHPSVPSGAENFHDLPPSYVFDMIHVLGGLRGPLLDWARSTDRPPHAIISDVFLGWTQRVAEELGIPRICFSASGANTVAVLHSLWRNMPKRDPRSDCLSFPEVPNSPTYPWWQMSPNYRRYREGEEASEFVRAQFLANIDSWGFVINSFETLDGACLRHLRADLGHPRVWAVGPMGGGVREGAAPELLRWLDGCPEGSVVYVCFGSMVILEEGQAAAVAAALERSGARFVWAVGQGGVPEGFEGRTEGRGVVLRGWAPQVAVLRHAAVGAFLSHCGWNSVLEAVSAGVVVLAWPMGADQFMNARLLVEEARVGVRVCEGRDAVPEVAALARALAEAASALRGKALEMGCAAREAVAAGGNSDAQLEEMVEELRRLSSE